MTPFARVQKGRHALVTPNGAAPCGRVGLSVVLHQSAHHRDVSDAACRKHCRDSPAITVRMVKLFATQVRQRDGGSATAAAAAEQGLATNPRSRARRLHAPRHHLVVRRHRRNHHRRARQGLQTPQHAVTALLQRPRRRGRRTASSPTTVCSCRSCSADIVAPGCSTKFACSQ